MACHILFWIVYWMTGYICDLIQEVITIQKRKYIVQEPQLCVSKTFAVFNRHKKYSCQWEGKASCNLTSLKRAEEYWIAWLNDRIYRKACWNLQLLWGCICVRRLDHEYFAQVWPTWTDYMNLTILQKYSRNGCACTNSRTRPLSLLPHGLGVRLNQTCTIFPQTVTTAQQLCVAAIQGCYGIYSTQHENWQSSLVK